MYTLKNDEFEVKIKEKGAVLTSIQDKNGREWLWQGNPDVWASQAPLLFPFIGRLKDSSYTYEGKTYEMDKHGFAKDQLFTVSEQSESKICFQLSDSAETQKSFPFSFTLTVEYRLEGNKLHKTHHVRNNGTGDMYYELGGHDGYNLCFDEGDKMDDYRYYLPQETEINPWEFDEGLMLVDSKKNIPLDQGHLTVKPSAFGLDCFILEGLNEKSVQLKDSKGKTRITMDFADFPFLTLWTMNKPFDTNYVCIEPWTSLPDCVFVGRDITEKEKIRCLSAGKEESFTFTSTFHL